MAEKTKLYWDACMFYEVLGNEPVTSQKKADKPKKAKPAT